jgi:hypothetical protein
MKFFGFRLAKVRRPDGEPPKTGGVLDALRRSPLVGADLNLARENRWEVLFKNGPRASDGFLNEREQPPAEERESL